MNRRLFINCSGLLLTVIVMGACGSDTNSPSTGDASTVEAAPTIQELDSSAGEAGSTPAAARNGIVVLNSDYQSNSVSLLDRDGNLLKDSCFNSGLRPQGLSMALSGDVALPTQTPSGGEVVVIDRQNSTLTWLSPSTCAPSRQLAVGTGFPANPHDFVGLSASKGYVVRFSDNGAATPTPEDFDDGNDLLIIDPSLPKILGRIDLRPFVPVGAGILPMADHVLLAEGLVYVSLNAISGDWSTYGEGRIVIVDPATDRVVGTLDAPGVKNCGAMDYLPAEKKLIVACNGDIGAGKQQAASSAIVVFDLAVNPPAIVAQVSAAAAGGVALSNWTVGALDGQTVLGVAQGDFSNVPPDVLWSMSLSGGASAPVFASAEGIAVGAILVDAERGAFMVADGTSKTSAFLRVFSVAAGVVTPARTVKTNPSHSLPPRALAWY